MEFLNNIYDYFFPVPIKSYEPDSNNLDFFKKIRRKQITLEQTAMNTNIDFDKSKYHKLFTDFLMFYLFEYQNSKSLITSANKSGFYSIDFSNFDPSIFKQFSKKYTNKQLKIYVLFIKNSSNINARFYNKSKEGKTLELENEGKLIKKYCEKIFPLIELKLNGHYMEFQLTEWLIDNDVNHINIVEDGDVKTLFRLYNEIFDLIRNYDNGKNTYNSNFLNLPP